MGKFIMRFDDTNPAKENAEFEQVLYIGVLFRLTDKQADTSMATRR